MRRNVILILGTFFFIVMAIKLLHDVIDSHCYFFNPKLLTENMSSDDEVLIIDDEDRSRRFSLREGDYKIRIDYESSTDHSILLSLDNDNTESVYLPANETNVVIDCNLEFPTDRAYFDFDNCESLVIRSISVTSEKKIYTDNVFKLGILLIIYILFIVCVLKYNSFSKTERFVLSALICMIICVNIPFYLDAGIEYIDIWHSFNPFNPATRFGIDTRAHLLRLDGVLFGLKDGQLPVIISPNYLNENGELSFLYPDIFLYPFAIMRFFGASMSFSYRLLGVCVNIMTCLSMFHSCRQVSDNDHLNILATCLYLFEPHRLMAMLEQGAIAGMALPYIFIPLYIVGMHHILEKNRKGILYTAIGVFGIMQSHILTMMLVLLLTLFVLLFFIREMLNRDRLMMEFKTILICIAMNGGFIVIFLYYWHKGVNTSDLVWPYTDYVLKPSEFLTDWQSLYLLIMLFAASALWYLSRKNHNGHARRLSGSLIIYSAVLLWFSTTCVPWGLLFGHFHLIESFFMYLQDPNRFYTVIAGSLIMSIVFSGRELKLGNKYNAFILAAVVICIPGIIIEYSDYLASQPLIYDEVLGDINSKDEDDYLPKGVGEEAKFSGVASLSDETNVESFYYKKIGTHVQYSYLTDKNNIYAEFPLLLYSGYSGIDESGKDIELQQGTDGRIRVYLQGDGVNHAIIIQYKVNPIFTVLWGFSLLFSIIFVPLAVRRS